MHRECFQLIYTRSYSACQYRNFSQKKTSPGSRYVKPLFGLRQYVAEKYFAFVTGYERILETKFPRAFKVYQVFVVGTKELYIDIKTYLRISQEMMLGKSVRDLTRKELEVYFQTPKDMRRVGPVLLIAILPFANYVIFPLAYMFPRMLLSRHYWSLQQRIDFAVQSQQKKLYNYRPVFRHLQVKLESVEDRDLKEVWAHILHKIGSGIHPTVSEILKVKKLFVNQPYGLYNLTSSHLSGLCHMHGLNSLPLRRSRLWHHAGFVREMDLAIIRERLVDATMDELRRACFLRGLNPLGLSKEDIISWLNDWTSVSRIVDRHSLSLLLHCPIFLAYNHPTNWALIH